MTLLLALLSVIAVWTFLLLLVVGLLLIRKPLESTRTFLQQVAMGVRAIDAQTAPLSTRGETLIASLHATGESVDRVARQLDHFTKTLQRTPTLLH